MARLYADENFHFGITKELRNLNHDILTAQDANQANRGVIDALVLAFAVNLNRAVLTHNRADYVKLHRKQPNHKGIIVVTHDNDLPAVAQRIDRALSTNAPLDNKLVRVNKPARSSKP